MGDFGNYNEPQARVEMYEAIAGYYKAMTKLVNRELESGNVGSDKAKSLVDRANSLAGNILE